MHVDPSTVEHVIELGSTPAKTAPTDRAPGPVGRSGNELVVLGTRIVPENLQGWDLARRELVVGLLDRGWSTAHTASASGVAEAQVITLADARSSGRRAGVVAG